MINQIRLVVFIVFSCFSFVGVSQKEITLPLKWSDTPLHAIGDESVQAYPNLIGGVIDDNEFLYVKEFKRGNDAVQWDFELVSYQTAAVDQLIKDYVKTRNLEVNTTPTFSFVNNRAMGEPITMLSVVPLIQVNGELRKLTSITFNRKSVNTANQKAHVFAANSVLADGSGEWYKISVKRDGVHKLDYDFLKSLGINVNNLNPSHIHVYGNGFGKLPEENSVLRPDDLIKNDILVIGEEDGKFDASDYVIFYGKGPHKWERVNNRFQRTLNIYAEYSAYYININSTEPPARISNAFTSSAPATNFVTDFNSFTIHEKEDTNVYKTGQRWYGEHFDAYLSQTFPMNIPNLNTNASSTLRGAVVSKVNGSGESVSFTFKYGNTTLASLPIGYGGDNSFSRREFTTAVNAFAPTSSNFTIKVDFNRNNPSYVGFLDYIEVNARSFLKFYDKLQFQDINSIGAGNVSEFQVTSFPNKGIVWEVTEPTNPKLVNGSTAGGTFSFKVNTDSLRTFFAFEEGSYLKPTFLNKVVAQDLHGLDYADYLIVTHPKFLSQANRLADLHRNNNGLSVHVVTTEQIYNEFSGGTQDPTAIKFFAKMFYDRAGGNVSLMPKYLLLFGDGTYDPLDRVANNNYYVPVYETADSESYTGSLVSDDYFGFLDDGESFGANDRLDIAIGRLTASTVGDATNLVNKIEHYMKNGSYLYAGSSVSCCDDGFLSTHGDWRLHYSVIADDEENNWFLKNDLEPATTYVEANHPEMNVKKIYLDAYTQITTAGGQRYPDVNRDIIKHLESGSIVTCFVGHGSPTSATAERVMTVGEVNALTNIDRLTLFVSATCEFGRMDDNERSSIGERMALNTGGGAIALMTTTRAVSFTNNTIVTRNFFKNVFLRTADGKPKTFGDIIVETKNAYEITQGGDTLLPGNNNKRSFMLLGDPALRIALPYEKVVLDSINEVDVSMVNDTLRALSKVKMVGHIEDVYGNKLTNFNGIVQPSVFDKPVKRTTLGQDPTSLLQEFLEQQNVLFKGRASVKNGDFAYEFIVPKDINYAFGEGKASFYGWSDNNSKNAGGYSKAFIIGGIDTTGLNDQEGPQVELFLNNEDFVNGGLTDETPILIAHLFDESGINTVGNGIGHDITLIIDDKVSEAKVLNDFYESDLDTYQSGKIRFQMEKLSEGLHTMTLKVWDVNNNSSERRIEFNVQRKKDIALEHVLNYPNPFTTHTEFLFEHNQVCAALETQIEIFTVTGRLVKTINELVETNGFRAKGIAWDGRDDFGDQLAKGVYIYRVTVTGPDGDRAREMQKLYLLK